MSTLETLKQIAESSPDALCLRRGIERETLRVDAGGRLAMTPHPSFLGSKLYHPLITTDFSESQLELITNVADTPALALKELEQVHRFICDGLDDELLWPASMPCDLPDDEAIPLAQYGTSNGARYKTTYRSGLGLRYGRTMQTICAVHYNLSFPDSFWDVLGNIEESGPSRAHQDRRYFDLMRNFRRWSWLLLYLFGASPAVSESFVRGRDHRLQRLGNDTWYLPESTSLRSGGLGYQSDLQSGLIDICYNSLDNYVHSLAEAICTEHPHYREISARHNGIVQLNANVLQLEAEFYSTVRAKRVSGDATLLGALRDDGVEYIEVRLMDIDPFSPTGITEETIRFLDAMLVYCLFSESPPHDQQLCNAVLTNQSRAVENGRGHALLDDQGREVALRDWGKELTEGIAQAADLLDDALGLDAHRLAVDAQMAKLEDPDRTPSARMLEAMAGGSFRSFGLDLARRHRQELKSAPTDNNHQARLLQLAAESLARWRETESEEELDFADYLDARQQTYESLLGSE